MVRYKVFQDFTLTQDHIDALTLLYQPVLSYPAISLYLTLHSGARQTPYVNERDLLKMLHVDSETLNTYRKELEQVGLIRSYQEEVIEMVLIQALTPSQFLAHDIYSRLFAIVVGQHQFAYYCDLFRSPKPQNLSNEITSKFDVARVSSWDLTSEEMYDKAINKELQHYQFDAASFMSNFSLFPKNLVTPDLLKLIAEYGSNYKVSQSDMKVMLLKTIRNNDQVFDLRIFASLIAEKHGQQSAESVDNIYDLDPLSFLRHVQGFDVNHVDRGVIERLQKRYDFENSVFNVLIETMLKTNHALNYSYALAIADPWVRQGVANYDDAIKALKDFESRVAKKPSATGAKSSATQPIYNKVDDLADESLLQAFKDNLGKDIDYD